MMQYGNIPGIKKKISRLIQGTVMIESKRKDYGFKLLDALFEMGCNAFDTAHVYGQGDNERTFGEWVNSRGIRKDIVVLGKGAHHNADRKRVTPYDITSDLHDSLARMNFDYIDLYVLHRDDPDIPVGPIVETLHQHKKDGLINAYGGSNWTADRIKKANAYAAKHGLTPFAVTSPHYSLAEMIEAPWPGCVSVAGPQGEKDRAWYARNDITICCWSSLSGGFFSGRLTKKNLADHRDTLYGRCYVSKDNLRRLARVEQLAAQKKRSVPQIALAYVLNQPLPLFPLVGCLQPKEFRGNAAALDIPLTPAELAYLDLKHDTL